MSRREALWRRWGSLLLALAAFAITAATLFARGGIGLSDNGDFYRVMTASSLEQAVEDRSFRYVDTFRIRLEEDSALGNVSRILFSPEGVADYPSIQLLPVRLSVVGSLVWNKLTGQEMSLYHLEILGFLYTVLYAAALGFLFSRFRLVSWRRDLAVKLVFLLVECDVGYTAYFNSLYGEGLQHIALLLCAAMLLHVLSHPPTAGAALACAGAAVLYGWSKFFNIPLALLILLVLEGILFLRGRRLSGALACAGGTGVLLAVFLAVPGWMNMTNTYNTIFFGVVRDTDEATAAAYLADLGLPEEMAVMRDTNYFSAGVAEYLDQNGYREAVMEVGKLDLVRFYLTHPGRLWEQLEITAKNCGMVRPFYLSNYGEDSPRMTLSDRFSLWSALRQRLPLDTLWAPALAAAVVLFLLLRRRGSRPEAALLCLLLLGALGYTFAVPIISNGEADLAKHMFAFAEIMDLLLLFLLAAALQRAAWRRPVPEFLAATAVGVLLALPPAVSAARGLLAPLRSHEAPEQGAYVSLGTWEGEELLWLVLEDPAADGSLRLVAARSVGELPYDGENANLWTESSLRAWLNSPFLEAFSPEELALLQPQERQVRLSAPCRALAQAGVQELHCSHLPALAARDCPEAYSLTAEDLVCLPDLEDAAALSAAGLPLAAGGPCWLEDPYYNNGAMVRTARPDGLLLFAEAAEPLQVRPCLTISAGQWSGSGSRGDPFRPVL